MKFLIRPKFAQIQPKWVKFGPNSAQNLPSCYSFENHLIFFSDFFAESWSIISTLNECSMKFLIRPEMSQIGPKWVKFGPDSAQNLPFGYSFENHLIFFSDFFAESKSIISPLNECWMKFLIRHKSGTNGSNLGPIRSKIYLFDIESKTVWYFFLISSLKVKA